VAAIEILKTNGRTQEYIIKGESGGKSLVDAMNDGELDGMQSFDKVLEGLARDKTVTVGTALAYATNRTNLQLNLHDLVADSEGPA
jgi:twitching motility protein PilT